MRWWIGTSGFSYKEWKGSFYPEDLSSKDMLGYYAGQLSSVELNNTFYRMPKASVVEGWRDRTPEGFSFVLKASRRITHQAKLKDAEDPLRYLLDVSEHLGPKRGPILFQLPPWLKKDVELLRDFVALFPEGFKAAFEFRSSSWFDDEVYDVLRDGNVALVTSDMGEEGKEDPPVVPTASYGYSRLRRAGYDDMLLGSWAERLSCTEWESHWVFFKHEDAGTGPRLAKRFEALVQGAHY